MTAAGGQQRNVSELALRAASALVLVAIALAATWQGGAVFALFCAAAAALAVFEYCRMVEPALPAGMRLACYLAIAAIVLDWFLFGPQTAFLLTVACIVAFAAWELAVRRSVWGALAIAYGSLPFMALVLLRGSGETGAHAIAFLFGAVWATDTFAYFAGRTIGGPKLAPAISPKKTVSGFVGGLLGAVAVAALVLIVLGYAPGAAILVLAAFLSVVSQLGDLFESWIKRRFDIKDSGAIIPGHGGVLDRIDGLVTAAVAAWVVGWLSGASPLVPGDPSQSLFTAFLLP